VQFTKEIPGNGPPLLHEPSLSTKVGGLNLFDTGGAGFITELTVSEAMVASLKGAAYVWDKAVDMYLGQMGDQYHLYDRTCPVIVVQSTYYTALLTEKNRGDKADLGSAFNKGVPRLFRERLFEAPCVVFVVAYNHHYSVVLLQNKVGDASDGPHLYHLDSCKGQGFHDSEEVLGGVHEGLLAVCPAKHKDCFAAIKM
jgi:hypothetical protein